MGVFITQSLTLNFNDDRPKRGTRTPWYLTHPMVPYGNQILSASNFFSTLILLKIDLIANRSSPSSKALPHPSQSPNIRLLNPWTHH